MFELRRLLAHLAQQCRGKLPVAKKAEHPCRARRVAIHEAQHDVGSTGSIVPSANTSKVTVQKMKASARRTFMATVSMEGRKLVGATGFEPATPSPPD